MNTSNTLKHTLLYDAHLAANARMVEFAGFMMPLHYGSQIEEHHFVRTQAGVFDVSHMGIIDVVGARAHHYLRYLLANDVARLDTPGQALYSCLLNHTGGIMDDLIVFSLGKGGYRLVVNAATLHKDLAFMHAHLSGHDARVIHRDDLAMLAVQGPHARAILPPLLPITLRNNAQALKPFSSIWADGWFVACTGYTGEDGFEVLLPKQAATTLWQDLLHAGVKPVGLGARDTLRLEAGMHLYGTDMDASITPLDCGLNWTVAWKPDTRDFIGRTALLQKKNQGAKTKLAGLILEGKGVLRNGMSIQTETGQAGIITSGGFAPTLKRSIALARVPLDCSGRVEVELRNRPSLARVIKPPFVRFGKVLVE